MQNSQICYFCLYLLSHEWRERKCRVEKSFNFFCLWWKNPLIEIDWEDFFIPLKHCYDAFQLLWIAMMHWYNSACCSKNIPHTKYDLWSMIPEARPHYWSSLFSHQLLHLLYYYYLWKLLQSHLYCSQGYFFCSLHHVTA